MSWKPRYRKDGQLYQQDRERAMQEGWPEVLAPPAVPPVPVVEPWAAPKVMPVPVPEKRQVRIARRPR